MSVRIAKYVSGLVLLGAFTFAGASVATAQDMVHVHMGHVSEAWGDTPDGAGFLPTALAEAEIAQFHANLGAQKPDNLEWMQTHAMHVLNAIDPGMMANGPGLGYGVTAASAGVAKHIGIAAMTEGASENVTVHAPHVSEPANNAIAWVGEMSALVESIQAATSADEAAGASAELLVLANQLLDGADANGDGEISWQEGGLRVAELHMRIMRDGEEL